MLITVILLLTLSCTVIHSSNLQLAIQQTIFLRWLDFDHIISRCLDTDSISYRTLAIFCYYLTYYYLFF